MSRLFIFRFFFVYLLFQALPLDWKFYKRLFDVDWLRPGLADLFNLSRYTPQIVDSPVTEDFWGIHRFADWGILALLALAAALVWTVMARARGHERLYQLLRVIIRYRLAIGVMAYGFLKIFPMQAPYPSLSILNTNYGDLSAWKLFSLSLGIAPAFEVFLGLVEILAAALLLYRKTVFLGSFIILAFTGNVFLSNLAYEGGETVYSLYLIQLALFLLWHDVPRLFRLLSLERPAEPDVFTWRLSPSQEQIRLAVKSVLILAFIVPFAVQSYSAFQQGGYQYPASKGPLKSGFYEVVQFVRDGDSLPFGKSDSLRWQNVVIEEWETLSVETGAYITPHISNVEVIHNDDAARDYEFSGTSTRNFYHYELNTASRELVLTSKNDSLKSKLSFSLKAMTKEVILLEGYDAFGHSLQVALQWRDKKYLLEEARKVGRRSRLIL